MANYIPVVFFPVKDDDIPNTLESWDVAAELIGKRIDNKEQYEFREVISRNNWFQDTLDLICKGLKIKGLEFVTQEIVCLGQEDIKSAIIAVQKVLDKIESGLPYLGKEIEEHKSNNLFYERNYYENGETKEYSRSQIVQAFQEAKVRYEIINYSSNDFQLKVDFYSFIKSLKASLEYCNSANKKMLYVKIPN